MEGANAAPYDDTHPLRNPKIFPRDWLEKKGYIVMSSFGTRAYFSHKSAKSPVEVE